MQVFVVIGCGAAGAARFVALQKRIQPASHSRRKALIGEGELRSWAGRTVAGGAGFPVAMAAIKCPPTHEASGDVCVCLLRGDEEARADRAPEREDLENGE